MKILHHLAHLFELNHGYPESFWIKEQLWTGFRCGTCGEINHAQRYEHPPSTGCRVLLFGIVPILSGLYAPGDDGPWLWQKHLRPWVRWACVAKREEPPTFTAGPH